MGMVASYPLIPDKADVIRFAKDAFGSQFYYFYSGRNAEIEYGTKGNHDLGSKIQ